ncbi:MAG: hypothetical protein JWM96_966, partial [Alphaproteobacteria bacterium]|nr:hypothetical protein [Alphaproteobacteria bacterium]
MKTFPSKKTVIDDTRPLGRISNFVMMEMPQLLHNSLLDPVTSQKYGADEFAESLISVLNEAQIIQGLPELETEEQRQLALLDLKMIDMATQYMLNNKFGYELLPTDASFPLRFSNKYINYNEQDFESISAAIQEAEKTLLPQHGDIALTQEEFARNNPTADCRRFLPGQDEALEEMFLQSKEAAKIESGP